MTNTGKKIIVDAIISCSRSLKEFAEKANIPYTTLHLMLSGQRKPSPDIIDAIHNELSMAKCSVCGAHVAIAERVFTELEKIKPKEKNGRKHNGRKKRNENE